MTRIRCGGQVLKDHVGSCLGVLNEKTPPASPGESNKVRKRGRERGREGRWIPELSRFRLISHSEGFGFTV